MSIKFVDLPDTITPEDYAKWRGIGVDHARNRFHAKGFPTLNVAGNRLIADKKALLMFELNIEPKDFIEFLNKSGDIEI